MKRLTIAATSVCLYLFTFLGYTQIKMPETGGEENVTDSFVLKKGNVSIEIRANEGLLEERYLVRKDNDWIEIAETRGESVGAVSMKDASNRIIKGSFVKLWQDDESSVSEELAIGKHRIIRKIEVLGDDLLHVTTRLNSSDTGLVHSFFDQFSFCQDPDWSYAPCIGGFIPDAYYKAPVIMCQSNSTAFAVLPDLNRLNAADLGRCNHFISLNMPAGRLLSAGFAPNKLVAHSVYAENQHGFWKPNTGMENAYFLLLTGEAEKQQAYRRAVRLHWDQFGRREQVYAADQQVGNAETFTQELALWDEWRPVVWEQETPKLWLDIPLPDGSLGGGVATFRWGPGPSVYLSSWFNSMRTAYGMALYAKRTGNPGLMELARRTVNLALKSPGPDGAFKCIAVPVQEGNGVVWGAGDGNGGSTGEGFLGYDMSWTAYWLLKWREAGLPYSDGILEKCRFLAQFFIERQEKDGFIPTRFDRVGAVQEDLSRVVKAETGPVALFLLQLYKQDAQEKYLNAAKMALSFLERSVIATRQWYDYETFWSCSPRTIPFDEISGQWPANNLALSQTVAAYLLAWKMTNNAHYLETGEALLDYLLLYQQCWTHPLIGGLQSKAALLGGFTTQNSDAEWSDARQSQIGNILMDYYGETGKVEYLERGIAALRAQFPISPYENVAHTGYGSRPSSPERVGHLDAVPPWFSYNRYPEKIRGVSSFHWGTGSGMAGIEMEEEFLHDLVVDFASCRGIGVNGINVTRCKIDKGIIYLDINSPFRWKRKPVIIFHNIHGEGGFRLIINNRDLGVHSTQEMEAGFSIDPAMK
ncbi:MAG: hypothetical protein V2B15_07445 [Bacteroidota bacterium]